MGRISTLGELGSGELASNDYLVVLDTSANIAKKISVANAFGLPSIGWTASGESWTYASATSINVPTGALSKYSKGMLIKLDQTTGGTKYFYITDVADTLLTIAPLQADVLENEAITATSYSTVAQPIGAPVATLKPADIAAFSVRKDTNQATGTGGGLVEVTWQSKNEYRNTDYFNLTNNCFVAPADGWVQISCTLTMIGGTGNDDSMLWGVWKNGTVFAQVTDNWLFHTRVGVELVSTITAGVPVSKGDEVSIDFTDVQNAITLMGDRCHFNGVFFPNFGQLVA